MAITSDHGEELLERGRVQHGQTMYEELIHVPLILRPPGGTRPRRFRDLVEVIDLFPTFIDLLELPYPEGMQGQSLVPYLLSGKRSDVGDLAYAEVNFRVNKYALRTKDWKIIFTPEGADPFLGGEGLYELYHLKLDPEEKTNLASSSADYETFHKNLTEHRKKLETISDSLEGRGGKEAYIDEQLLDQLREHGYVR
jgi:arylsulfatase A-like enzyme